jgi:cytochrome c biogenesis protein CcmG, thiol:disulfide interchange protein DsbE
LISPPKTALTLVAAAAALGLAACGSGSGAGNPDSKITAKQATTPIDGAPPQLASIRAQGNQILDGGEDAFAQRLDELRGTPVVVNKWASWCGPCRLEFPSFQSEAEKRGGETAFLGVLSDDSRDAGESFLGQLPLPYPSYLDEGKAIAGEIGAPQNFPATAFYDSTGKLVYTRQGVYPDQEALAADIDRYAR